MRQRIRVEREETSKVNTGTRNGTSSNGTANGVDEWSSDELALLIKAVNVFPAGTVQRYIMA
jgi:hypothetical protein